MHIFVCSYLALFAGYVPFFEKAGVVHLCPERLESIVSTWCYPVGMRQVAKDVTVILLLFKHIRKDGVLYRNCSLRRDRCGTGVISPKQGGTSLD